MLLRRTLLALSGVLLLGVMGYSPATAGPAEKPKPKISDTRPFTVAKLDVKAALELTRQADEGDEDAIAELEQSGLTYVPLLLGLPSQRARAYSLMRKHADWVRAMQGWEVALVHPDPVAVKEAFIRLKDRFWRSETQLARAILHADACGLPQIADDLAALDPDSDWVQAALAFTGRKYSGLEAIQKMRAIEVDFSETARWNLLFSVAMVLGPELKGGQAQVDVEMAYLRENFGKPELLREFDTVPREWRAGGLHERIGTIAVDTLSDQQLAEMEKEILTATAELVDGKAMARAWTFAAMTESRDLTIDLQSAGAAAHNSRGAAAIPLALWCANNGMPSECMALSLTAFHGAPQATLPQRMLISQAAGSGDEKLVRLAARAIMALAPDCIDSYRNILRGLYRVEGFGALADAFKKALADCGHQDLKTLAAALKDGKWEVLNPRDRRPLKLDDATQAKLLAVFCDPDELALHGGPQGVLWLNRAVFLEGSRKLFPADAAYRQAIWAAAGKTPPAMHPNIYQYFMFRQRSLGSAARASFDAMIGKQDAAGQAALAKLEAAFLAPGAPDADNAPLAAWRHWQQAHGALPESLIKELKGSEKKWGGAAAVAVARSAFDAQDYGAFRDGLERAQRQSPLDFDVYYRWTPRGEDWCTSVFGNWEFVSRNVYRLGLLHPFSHQTVTWFTLLGQRSGAYGLSADIACNSSLARAPYPCFGENEYEYQVYRFFGRNLTWRSTLRIGLVSFSDMSATGRKDIIDCFDTSSFSRNAYYFLEYAGMYGVLPYFGRLTLNEITAAYNMKDVNNLLDVARNIGRLDPKVAIELVGRADDLGVSRYGRFVGTQTLCQAHGRLGTLDDIWERYQDMRAGKTGVPRFLDKYMLAGVTGGNQYKQLDKVMGAIEKYGPDTGDSEFSFYWRRAHMAAGRHDKIRDLPLGAGTRAYPYRSFGEATSLFHEARALLDAGEFATLAERTDPYLVDFIEATIGEYADAAVLRAIATKLSGAKDSPFPTAVLQRMAETERLLDYQVLQNLAGTRIGALPAASAKAFWHGKFWSERVPAFGGEGRASDAEIAARDPYMRGVLAWLAGDNEVARSELKKCIEADQRCSHEYHVAQWLLAHPLAEKQKEEPK